MEVYKKILDEILTNGTTKSNRTGEDTISLFGYSYKIDLAHGFPLLTCKKINFDNILFELLWFLGNDNSPDFLHKHGIQFWDDWIEEDGKLPEAYGKYWRSYPNDKFETFIASDNELSIKLNQNGFDQFTAIINELKTNPNSRRMVLTNWNPPSAWQAKLPPCHMCAIFNVQYDYSNPYLNLHLTQRSADVPIGVPYNIASYALLLKIVGNIVKIPVGYFSHTLVDAHIYKNQIEATKIYLNRECRVLPRLHITENLTLERLDELIKDGTTEEIKNIFKIKDYNPHSFIKFPVMV